MFTNKVTRFLRKLFEKDSEATYVVSWSLREPLGGEEQVVDRWAVMEDLDYARDLYDRLLTRDNLYAACITTVIENTEHYTTHPKLQYLKRKA